VLELGNLIEARNLVKTFKIKESSGNILKDFVLPTQQSFRALDDVTISVKEGETLGLLGPNGAGKTTLTKCMCDLLSPDEGQVLIDDRPVEQAAQKIGVTFGYNLIYHRLTGYDNLKFFAKLYGVKDYKNRIKELAGFFELGNWVYNYVENYSLGMKAKLALARALIHDPEVLLLDEPTLGLDLRIASIIRKEIKGMKKTIVLTTHYMHEAHEMCNRIAIINKGKIAAIDTPERLKKLVEKNTIVEISSSNPTAKLLNELRNQEFVHNISYLKGKMRIIMESKSNMPELLLLLSRHNIMDVKEYEPTLEDVFLKVVGGE